MKKLKLDKNPSEEGQEIYDLRRSLRHIKVFLEEFQEEFPEHKDKKGHSMSFKNVLKAQVMKRASACVCKISKTCAKILYLEEIGSVYID